MTNSEQEAESLIDGVSVVRAIMASRYLNSHDMDRMCGFKPKTFSSIASKGFPSSQSRATIERALGVRIWTCERDFELRSACHRKYGFDPALLTLIEARQWVRKLELSHRCPPQPNREQLIEAILQHLAVNPNRK